jgi:hypothetical protein
LSAFILIYSSITLIDIFKSSRFFINIF